MLYTQMLMDLKKRNISRKKRQHVFTVIASPDWPTWTPITVHSAARAELSPWARIKKFKIFWTYFQKFSKISKILNYFRDFGILLKTFPKNLQHFWKYFLIFFCQKLRLMTNIPFIQSPAMNSSGRRRHLEMTFWYTMLHYIHIFDSNPWMNSVSRPK